jgi:hypothetical protein
MYHKPIGDTSASAALDAQERRAAAEPASGELLSEAGFHLDSVVPTADPTGGAASWFRYVISQGATCENAITGTKSGSLADVHLQLHYMVTRLNERFGKLQARKK